MFLLWYVIVYVMCVCVCCVVLFFCQAEDGIRDLVRSRGLGDVYKRQPASTAAPPSSAPQPATRIRASPRAGRCGARIRGLSLIHI